MTSKVTTKPMNNSPNHGMARESHLLNNQNHIKARQCHGSSKMLKNGGGFKKYQSCENGLLTTKSCPQGTIFYFAIQCCVPIAEFPCKANCVRDKLTVQHESHDYAYFHY